MSFTLAVVVRAPQSKLVMPAIHRVDGTAWGPGARGGPARIKGMRRQRCGGKRSSSDGAGRCSVRVSAAMPPRREVHHAEALAWLRARGRLDGCSVVTSLPDVVEMGGSSLAAWTDWFVEAAGVVLGAVPDDGVAVFFQSDVKRGSLWIDKGALVQRAADRAGTPLLFHK